MASEDCNIGAASNHKIALETSILKAREAGFTEDEILHALILLISTTGFPSFMGAYLALKKID
jgi:4-carboxymuconolactone decarboxylase